MSSLGLAFHHKPVTIIPSLGCLKSLYKLMLVSDLSTIQKRVRSAPPPLKTSQKMYKHQRQGTLRDRFDDLGDWPVKNQDLKNKAQMQKKIQCMLHEYILHQELAA